MFPPHLTVGCVAPWSCFSIRVATVVFIQIFAREVFWGPVVLVRGLFTPVLTCMSRDSDGHLPSVALPSALQTLVRWARRGWWCCTAGNVTEFPAFVGIHGETPWAGLPIRVTAVIHLQVLAWKFGRNISMSMWGLRVPGLALESRLCLGNFALIIFPTAMHTFLFTFWNVAVVEPHVWVCGVAPGPVLVVVRVPAIVLLQPLQGVLLRRIVRFVRRIVTPFLTGNVILRFGHGPPVGFPISSLAL